MLKTNKEYMLLFAVVAVLGLLIYSSTAVSQNQQDITITTFFPAPFGIFNEVSAWIYRDFDDGTISPAPPLRYIDPSGMSVLQSLRVTSGIVAEIVSGPGGSFTFDLGTGDATLNNVYATRFYQNSTGPAGPAVGDGTNADTVRGVGKYIYDIAEGVFAREGCEVGDVVLISDDAETDVMKSTARFDARVAGIISEDPKIYMGSGKNKVPLALAGVTRCKATTENGSIKRGDLLVTSSLPGHAMKADPKEVKPGMLVGKAMQPLKENTGKIYILVNKK